MIKSKVRWVIVGALGFLVLLAIVAAVLLPRLIDAESYRGLLRSNLERQLGRQVEFGAMELSLWPVLGLRLDDLAIGRTATERFEKPVVADSLRVGARLLPLLRGRLDVTSLTIEGPVLSVYRRGDGTWEPVLDAATDPGTAPGADQAVQPAAEPHTNVEVAPLVIEQLRVTGGRVVLRLDEPGGLRETTLKDVTLELTGLGADEPIVYDFSAGLGASATLRSSGNLQLGDAGQGRPLQLSAQMDLEKMDPSTLREWLAALAPTQRLPEQLLAERPFSCSATIEYTGSRPARLAIADVVVKQLGLKLVRSASGVWINPFQSDPAPRTQEDGDAATLVTQLSNLTIEDASIQIEDRAVTGAARAMTSGSARGPTILGLNALRLSLDRLPTAAPAAFALEAQVGSGTGGKLEVRGTLGPLGDDPAAMPLDLSLKLGAVAFDDLRSFLPTAEGLDVSTATAAADLQLSGSFAGKLDIRGQASLANATVSLVAPQGGVRKLPFDMIARGNVALSNSAARIELSNLELELPRDDANRRLTIRGSLDTARKPPHLDMELLPTRVAADDLAALAALFVSDASLSFGSPDPVELELRARGPFGAESLPELEGQATLSGFTFRVAGMAQPMEKVGAKVTFTGRQITLDGLEGVIGKSSVTASRVVLTDFEAPRIQVDLKSQNADFWELFSFIESEETAPGAATPVASGDALGNVTVEGTLRIDRGSLQTLAFEKLTTGMDFRGGVVTLAPLEMSLYGGTFSGKLVQDLNAGVLTISGNGTSVDANGFLAQNLDLGGLISGLASTEQNLQVRAADPANVLAGVSGGGPLQIADGRLAKLDVLKSLSKVTGIFGERSLQRLTKQFATAGTSFRRAETTLRLEGGTLNFDALLIETAELTLAGRASLDSATGKLEGRFEVAISPELSAAMREEQSRAASVFWDAKTQRVSFGFGVEGPAAAPTVSVDWDRALRGVAEREIGNRLRGFLEKKLPGPSAGAPPASPTPPAAQTGVAPSPGATTEAVGTATEPGTGDPDRAGPGATSGGAGTSAGASAPSGSPAGEARPGTKEASLETPTLVVEIASSRWTGPVLLRDLMLEGTVGGPGIERASLTAVDARGAEVQTIDRLGPVDDQLGSIGDRDADLKLSWAVKIDGKRLLVARFPVKITVTVYDKQGRSASVSRDVNR